MLIPNARQRAKEDMILLPFDAFFSGGLAEPKHLSYYATSHDQLH
jgi:hypothetical protein